MLITCVLLRKLEVTNFPFIKYIKLKAPKLQHVSFKGLYRTRELTIGKNCCGLRTLNIEGGLFLDIARLKEIDKKISWIPKVKVKSR